MSGLRDWLRAHNLEQLAKAFEANDIDVDILSELTDEDFEKLGVSLGNRRRLLKAITKEGVAATGSKAASAEASELSAGASEASAGAERRQVTVLFCDMVGSTALSGEVDPELLGALIRRYQDAAAGAIGRYGGFVAKFMGDGVLAYFGFPQAFEDAAERAVRAAIGILTEVGKIARPDGTGLQARVGIATGLVVVGEIVGKGSAQERTIVGETPNLAARLQALAAPEYHCRWSTGFFSGDVASCLKDAEIGIQTYDMGRHGHLGNAFGGHDPGVCAHICRANMLQLMGDRTGSNSGMERGLALAEALDQPNSVGHALHNSGMCRHLVGDREGTFAIARRLNPLTEKFGLGPWRGGGLLLLAWASATGSGVAEAARLVDTEIEKATATGPIPQYYLGLAAEVLLAAGRPGDGLSHLDRAIAAIDESGVGFYLPEIYRLHGECLLALDRDNKGRARQDFMMASDIARRQGAIIFRRRAEASLAELAG